MTLPPSENLPSKTGQTLNRVSLQAAESLTGLSRRTLWRRIADGTLRRLSTDSHGRTMLPLSALASWCPLSTTPDFVGLVQAADAGDADAQCELAMRFLELDKPTAAQYWLEQAAHRKHPEAIHWLAICNFKGWGRKLDETQGMMWLARSAALGHPIAKTQILALRPSQS